MTTRLVYETHATTLDNEAGIATGWLPGELSDTGKANARDLGVRRRGDGIEVVYTSDLARAVATAQIAFADTDLEIRQDRRLRECDYGELNGGPSSALSPRSRFVHDPFPGGQSYLDVLELTRDLLADLARDHDGRSVLLIAHSANRWALQHLFTGVPLDTIVDAPFDWQPGWEYVLTPRVLRRGGEPAL